MSKREEALKRVRRITRACVFGNYAHMGMLVDNGKCPGCVAGWETNPSGMHLTDPYKDHMNIQAIPCVQDWLDGGVVAP